MHMSLTFFKHINLSVVIVEIVSQTEDSIVKVLTRFTLCPPTIVVPGIPSLKQDLQEELRSWVAQIWNWLSFNFSIRRLNISWQGFVKDVYDSISLHQVIEIHHAK